MCHGGGENEWRVGGGGNLCIFNTNIYFIEVYMSVREYAATDPHTHTLGHPGVFGICTVPGGLRAPTTSLS